MEAKREEPRGMAAAAIVERESRKTERIWREL